MMSAMNVVYIHTHDTGRRVSPYGHAVHTPNPVRLARDGVLFRKAFCAAPTCSPSRAALLTGQCAHASGMLGLHHRGFRLAHPERHLANVLRQSGYDTALVGINHVAADVAEVGYGRVIETESPDARHVGPLAAAFLRGRPTEPFFLDVGFVQTHRGRFPDESELHPGDDPRHQNPPATLPDVPETRLDAARFATSARLMDAGMGQVLDALDAAGLAHGTVVICTTDHGIGFPLHKCTCRDGGIGVMLMMRGPQAFLSGGRTCDALASHLDVVPTLCDLLGLVQPDWLEGRSLLPVLRGEVGEVNEEVFAEVTYHAAYEPQRAVRTKRYKLIRRFGDRLMPAPSNVDDGPSKDAFREVGGFDRPHPREALYDLLLDPCEGNNLADDPRHAATLADLRGRLERWMADTNDPLLAGPVPLPPGANANRPGDASPNDPVTTETAEAWA